MSFNLFPYQVADSSPSALLDFSESRSLMRVTAELGFTVYFNLEEDDTSDDRGFEVQPKGAFILVTDNGQVVKLEYEKDGQSILTHTGTSAVSGISGLSVISAIRFMPGEADKYLKQIFDAVKTYSSGIVASRPKRVLVQFPWEPRTVSRKSTKIHFQFKAEMQEEFDSVFRPVGPYDYSSYDVKIIRQIYNKK